MFEESRRSGSNTTATAPVSETGEVLQRCQEAAWSQLGEQHAVPPRSRRLFYMLVLCHLELLQASSKCLFFSTGVCKQEFHTALRLPLSSTN